MTGEVLVVGYGNPLRGDDGVGRRVAEAVAGWQLPGVRAVSAHQLTPELAESIAAVRVAVFVDAHSACDGARLRVQPVHRGEAADPLGHAGDPRSLLALAEALYGARPTAWLVTVPGTSFDLGEGLSPAAAAGMAVAFRWIRGFLERELLVPRGVSG